MSKHLEWHRFTLRTSDSDEESFTLFELGAKGVEILSPTTLAASFFISREAAPSLIERVEAGGFSLVEHSIVPEENWVKKSAHDFPQLQIGELRIVPVMDSSAPPHPSTNEILVVPGFGFGTGHHPTTHMILELMQHPQVVSLVRPTIADMGTGSGILSAAASVIFPESSILGIDNDEQALISAATTFELNPSMHGRVRFDHGSFDLLVGPYDLLLANLYDDPIRKGIEAFTRVVKSPGGIALFSGLLAEQESTLDELFREPDWTTVTRRARDGWIARMIRRN